MSRADDPFETYLLRVLCALIAEQSVSRTAIRMNQSQPAISAALKRLREIFNDPLLVRDKNTMVPTARALAAAAQAQSALGLLDGLLNSGEGFDASTTERSFTIAMPDYLAPPFLAQVVRSFRAQAPNARLVAQPLGPQYDYELALQDGAIEIVIGNWPEPPEHLHSSTLLEDDIVCLMAEDHPWAADGELSAERYLRAAHVVPMPYSIAQRGVVESSLATLRVSRDRRVQCPYFGLAPNLLPGTDLIMTTSRHFADYYARRLPLAIRPSPIEFARMRFYQLWHASQHRAAPHVWLRGLLTAASQVLTDPDSQ
ncbi:LysR family transcriptional regulator [Variovorax sp. WS11]|uniref:LysR family transcriptional regulator n=1 Tax=Variovorax sp. WS11 TaxID=1105204 RepID=UPI000D0D83CB|nr:LysR family transcriptional regulator [Variovorax sp. WS11]NDZ11761.1 LysR family transcriptional regulator [Variovorax sp. WS11]PSL86407.1 LysR family transcriptional regulator [Variovorax sp. WS11]